MIEVDIMDLVRAKLSVGPVRLFRNNVGLLVDAKGNYVRYGLCPGSSDLIGWRSVTIRPVDVGNEFAIFCAIEVKSQYGKPSDAQERFINQVQRHGGLAGIARSLEDARHILRVDE